MNLAPIADLLERRIGLDAASLGSTPLRTAVAERMRALAIADPAAYADILAGQSDEFDGLVNRLLVPETWFFRGGELFAALTREIASRMSSSERGERILCLPCSTGEEPYSLAMALLDAGVPAERWRIDGVDLSQRCIDAAMNGTYREFSFRQMPPEVRDRYFRPAGTGWSLDSAVRGLVRFQVGNIMDPALLGRYTYDFILCRNLLIYLTADARVRTIANLERLLAPGGFLAVGHAEPQILAARGYQRFGPDSCFLYRRESSVTPPPKPTPVRVPVHRQPKAAVIAPAKPAVAAPAKTVPSLAEARRLADQNRLAEAFAMCRDCLVQVGPSSDAFSLLGILHQALGNLPEASDAFRKALYLNPDHSEALTHAMLLSSQLGDETRAVALRERLARIGGEQ